MARADIEGRQRDEERTGAGKSAQAAGGAPELPCATRAETTRVLAEVIAPVLARGAVLRRPRAVALAARLDADRRAVEFLTALRARYESGPLRLAIPGRTMAITLRHDEAARVLAESPDPFALVTVEKRAALAHFQPDGVLISPPEDRPGRRRLNEDALTPGRRHPAADDMAPRVDAEMRALLARAEITGELTWEGFAGAWWRAVRRIVLGDVARDDNRTTDLLRSLRGHANGAYLTPVRRRARAEFLRRVQAYADHAEPGTLAARVAGARAPEAVRPAGQIPHWLFAFDAAGMATWTALTLLTTHRDEAAVARREATAATNGADLPYLRACLLEALRLWPTTPLILRRASADTWWDGRLLPAGADVVVHAPLLHRGPDAGAHANRFTPAIWADGRAEGHAPYVPFSAGPGICPGRDVALLVGSYALAALVSAVALRPVTGVPWTPDGDLPGTFDHVAVTFATGGR